MTIFITIIHILVCFTLISVILLQAGRGQGLTGASFGGGNVQSLLGTRAADFMTKATTIAAVSFMLTCLTLDIMESRKSRSLLETGTQQTAIDLDQIKEALEKVKSEAVAEGESAAGAMQGEVSALSEQDAESIAEAAGEQAAVVEAAAQGTVEQVKPLAE